MRSQGRRSRRGREVVDGGLVLVGWRKIVVRMLG